MDAPELLPLDIDLDDLVMALTWRDPYLGSAHYLDHQGGQLIFVSDDVDATLLPPDFDAEDDERWPRIEPIASSRSWEMMSDFVEQLADRRLADRLDRVLHGPKPFRRFKDVLTDHPEQREAWFAFERTAMERVARRWCEDNEIAPRWVGRGFP